MNLNNSTPIEREIFLRNKARELLLKKSNTLTAKCEYCGKSMYKKQMIKRKEWEEDLYYCHSCLINKERS